MATPRAEPTLILWDLVGSCNLRCPSCPMGSMPGVNPKGFIADELFHAMLAKLQRDFVKCRQLHFYNWTEPLLHPRIVEYCRAAADAGFHVHLSSNLNHLKDAAALLTSGIKTFRISLSGFTQEVYAIGHRGGYIDKVKRNMRLLADAKRAGNSRRGARVHVYFHKYRHNLHEIAPMEAFARELGFDFLADWAFLMPLEKLLAYADGMAGETERAFADEFILPPVNQALAATQPFRARGCELIEQLVLDHRGRALLCCATFDTKANVIGDYLELDWPEMQHRRYAHSMCGTCMSHGAHVLYTNVSDPALRAEIATLAERAISSPPAAPSRDSIALPILREAHPALAKSA